VKDFITCDARRRDSEAAKGSLKSLGFGLIEDLRLRQAGWLF